MKHLAVTMKTLENNKNNNFQTIQEPSMFMVLLCFDNGS